MALVIPSPAQSGFVLSDYIYRTRNLLHDATARMYSDELITTNVNDARERVARDSCCVRFLQTNAQYGITLTAGTEVYNTYSFLPLGPVTVDVMGVTVYWGNQRVELDYYAWSRFTAMLRPWQTYQALPCAFARYAGNFYVGPKPDQSYAIDVDTALIPNKMFDDATPEQIINPFQVAVPFYA